MLNWATASEHNSSHFSIMGRIDGENWREIKQMPSAGNSTERLIYSFTLPFSHDLNYVKLNQFDVDGKMQVFGPFNINCDRNFNDLLVFPNPASEKVTIQLENKNSDTEGLISLYSTNGQLVNSMVVPFLRGNNNFILQLNELNGVYILEFKVGKITSRKKIVIM